MASHVTTQFPVVYKEWEKVQCIDWKWLLIKKTENKYFIKKIFFFDVIVFIISNREGKLKMKNIRVERNVNVDIVAWW